jgi:Arc/MetJ-type ribon-helix-helix transcriptional regulator
MTIHIPPSLENPILAAVQSGRYASLDDAMTEAAAMLVERLKHEQTQAKPASTGELPDPLLGSMPDAADELDEIVADAMKRRREEPWRAFAGE